MFHTIPVYLGTRTIPVREGSIAMKGISAIQFIEIPTLNRINLFSNGIPFLGSSNIRRRE